jgi:hypothetical protein
MPVARDPHYSYMKMDRHTGKRKQMGIFVYEMILMSVKPK